VAAAVRLREVLRQLGAVAAVVLLACASLMLMQCTYAFLLDTGEPRSPLWSWIAVSSLVVAITSLLAYRHLEPLSRYFFAPLAATPVVMPLCASMLATLPLPGVGNQLVVYAFIAAYAGLLIHALWRYFRDRKTIGHSTGA
jgi:undecaprenyl pyrophosphate phosphatase UppP